MKKQLAFKCNFMKQFYKTHPMKSNIGKTDKIIRIIPAIAIAAVGIYFKSWWVLVAMVLFFNCCNFILSCLKFLGLNSYTNKSVQ